MRRKRLIYYVLLILSLVGISFYGGVVSYGIFCALLVLPVMMYSYLIFVLVRFKMYQQLGTKTVVCRTPVSYYFTLQNETGFAFARLKVRFFEFGVDYGDLKCDEEYELLQQSGYRVTTNIVCKYRGEYEIGVKQVIITDFLGLFRVVYNNREPFKVNVFPAVEYPSDTMMEDRKLSAGLSVNNVQTVRDVLVRPYIEGDPMRSINWKATAKTRKLMTSKMVSEEHTRIHIVLDTERLGDDPYDYIPREDELLTRLITTVLYYVRQNIGVELSFYSQGMKHVALSNMQGFEDFYSAVAAVIFTTGVRVDDIYDDMLKTGRISEPDSVVLRQGEGTL